MRESPCGLAHVRGQLVDARAVVRCAYSQTWRVHVPNRARRGFRNFPEKVETTVAPSKHSSSPNIANTVSRRQKSRWPMNKCCAAGRSSLGVQIRCGKNSQRCVRPSVGSGVAGPRQAARRRRRCRAARRVVEPLPPSTCPRRQQATCSTGRSRAAACGRGRARIARRRTLAREPIRCRVRAELRGLADAPSLCAGSHHF